MLTALSMRIATSAALRECLFSFLPGRTQSQSLLIAGGSCAVMMRTPRGHWCLMPAIDCRIRFLNLVLQRPNAGSICSRVLCLSCCTSYNAPVHATRLLLLASSNVPDWMNSFSISPDLASEALRGCMKRARCSCALVRSHSRERRSKKRTSSRRLPGPPNKLYNVIDSFGLVHPVRGLAFCSFVIVPLHIHAQLLQAPR